MFFYTQKRNNSRLIQMRVCVFNAKAPILIFIFSTWLINVRILYTNAFVLTLTYTYLICVIKTERLVKVRQCVLRPDRYFIHVWVCVCICGYVRVLWGYNQLVWDIWFIKHKVYLGSFGDNIFFLCFFAPSFSLPLTLASVTCFPCHSTVHFSNMYYSIWIFFVVVGIVSTIWLYK